MRILKNILIGFGVLFLLILVLVGWVGVRSSQFRTEEAPFVQTFVTDLSKRWDIADVYDRSENTFIEQATTPQAQQLLHQFKQLGPLKSVHDLELRNYISNNRGRTGLFSFKGTFENGEAVVDADARWGLESVELLKRYGLLLPAARATSFRSSGHLLQQILIRAGR